MNYAHAVFDDIGHQVELLHQDWWSDPPVWLLRLDEIMQGGRFCCICGCTENWSCGVDSGIACRWAGMTPYGVVCSRCEPRIESGDDVPVFQPGLCTFPESP